MEPIERTELIAGWGQAKLIRFLDGHYELQGGTLDDRKAATAWIKQFMPNVAEELRERQRGTPENSGDEYYGIFISHLRILFTAWSVSWAWKRHPRLQRYAIGGGSELTGGFLVCLFPDQLSKPGYGLKTPAFKPQRVSRRQLACSLMATATSHFGLS